MLDDVQPNFLLDSMFCCRSEILTFRAEPCYKATVRLIMSHQKICHNVLLGINELCINKFHVMKTSPFN